jgi:hypothetical protein
MKQSQLFGKFNQLRASGQFEQGRVNRALGCAQNAQTPHILATYKTDAEKCGCPDFIYRMQHVEGGACKHMIAKQLLSA